MSMINYASREINCKIVYYGPGLGGKTTNLEYVYGKVSPSTRGKLISLATETERTLYFDFLPLFLGQFRAIVFGKNIQRFLAGFYQLLEQLHLAGFIQCLAAPICFDQ